MSENLTEKYKVPSGLRPLLEAFARETLRLQPTDLLQFGQLFFDLLQTHKKQNPELDVIQDNICYEMFRNDLQLSLKNQQQNNSFENISRPSSPMDLAATKIQALFRGHCVRNHPEKYGINSVPLTRRRSTERLKLADNKKDVKRHSIGGYSQVYCSPEDRAATKIQAEIRGYLTRKRVENAKVKNLEAATKIQANIRGFLTRKHLEEKGLLSPSRSYNSLQSVKSDEN